MAEAMEAWQRARLIATLRDCLLTAAAYLGLALIFRWRGFDWWWYWPLHITLGILRSDYGPLGP